MLRDLVIDLRVMWSEFVVSAALIMLWLWHLLRAL